MDQEAHHQIDDAFAFPEDQLLILALEDGAREIELVRLVIDVQVVVGFENLIRDQLGPFAMEAADAAVLVEQFIGHALDVLAAQLVGRQKFHAVVDEVFAHHRHGAEHAWHPILVRDHAALFAVADKDRAVDAADAELPVQFVRGGADSLLKDGRLRVGQDGAHDLHGILSVELAVSDHVELAGIIDEAEAQPVRGGKAKRNGIDQPVGNEFHDPGQGAARLDRVKAHRVDKVIQYLRRALVEDANLRAERVIRLIILFVGAVELLADHGTGLAAVLELLGLDGFLVELGQIML